MVDDYGNELPAVTLQQINARFDKGSQRMADIERDLSTANAELTATRNELRTQLADLLEFFEAMRGAFKVLNWLGKLAKPAAAIVGLGAACITAWSAWRGVR